MQKNFFNLFNKPVSTNKKAILLPLLLLALFSVGWSANTNPAEAMSIIHVNKNATGANNGTTWKNAYTDLQSALAAASSGDEIWVAAGVYVPTGLQHFSSFELVDGVAVYGGFDASETTRAQRDIESNLTILSGDIGGDDTTNSDGIVVDPNNIVGTNIRNIVVATSVTNSTILDGFTITAGNDGFFGGAAGGLKISSGSPTIENVHLIGNRGLYGGAISVQNSSNPRISGATIESNIANSRGGGIYIGSSSNPFINNAIISNNNSGSAGGGIYSESSNPTLTNLVVSGNSTNIDGGGIFLSTGPSAVLNNLLISGNTTNSNSGTEGGGLHLFDSDITLTNLTIVGNFSALGGGVVNNFGTVSIHNSIIWGNDDSSSVDSNASSYANFNAWTSIQFSTVEIIAGSQNGGNNSGADPLFMSPINVANAPTTAGDFQLQSSSPAIDAGSSALYTSSINNDLAGNARINGSAIDMGAYESNFIPLSLTVNGNGSGSVTASGINCPGDCSEAYVPNTMVTLTASPSTGTSFAGWSGAAGCSNSVTCVVTMDSAKNVTATFNLSTYDMSAMVVPSNGGTLTSSPTGINCPGDCNEGYLYGTQVTFTPTAAAGFEFTGWSGGVSCSGLTPCVVTVDTARLVVANFAAIYTLTTNKSGAGSGTISSNPSGINCGSTCSMSATDGTVIELTAAPSANSIFTGWSGGGCTGTGTCSVTLDASKTVSANFEPTFDLAINKTGSGSGTVTSVSPLGIDCGSTCTQPFQAGSAVVIQATAAPGSAFTGWSGGGCSTAAQCVVVLSSNQTVTANFVLKHELSVAKTGSGAGTVTSSPAGINCGSICSMLVNEGDAVTLTATADSGSLFTGWSISKCADDASCTVGVSQAQTVTATFESVYTLTVAATGDGSGSVSDSTNTIDCIPACSMTVVSGTAITLTATAASGSTFTGWTGNSCTSTDNICTLTLNASETVTATFAQLFGVDVTKDGTGSGTVTSIPSAIDCGITCTAQVASGTMMTLTAKADSGSVFDGWSGEGCSGTGMCVLPITASRSVTATFTDSPTARDLAVTTTGDGNGTVTSNPAGIDCGSICAMSVADGTVVTLTATADAGSVFTGWSGAGCSGTGVCTVTLDEAKSVSAEFELATSSSEYLIYLPLITRP